MIPHACMRSCLLCIYIYDSTSSIYHSPLKYKVPQWYVKCIRLLSIGNTIYAYLFIYVPQLYVYTIFPTIHMCEVRLSIGTSYYNLGGLKCCDSQHTIYVSQMYMLPTYI